MTTGQLIKVARKKAGMTQADLARKLGISYVNISQLEKDQRNPTIETLQRIAVALGTTVNWLLPPENYWEDENGVGHSEPMPEVSEQVLEKRLQDSYGAMTVEGKGKVVGYAEDILPRYRAQERPQAPAPAPEGKDTVPPPETPKGTL